jgi:hypothetical protein
MKICTVGFNTTSTVLLNENLVQNPVEEIERIVLEGALFTGDKTTIQINQARVELFGTFDWKPEDADNVKELIVTPAFGGARVGMLTVYFRGASELNLKSKFVGTTAALPTPLQSRM